MSKSDNHKIFKAMAAVTQLGLDIISPLILCIFAANYLVEKFELSSNWMLAAIIVGVLSGILNLVRFVKQTNGKK